MALFLPKIKKKHFQMAPFLPGVAPFLPMFAPFLGVPDFSCFFEQQDGFAQGAF